MHVYTSYQLVVPISWKMVAGLEARLNPRPTNKIHEYDYLVYFYRGWDTGWYRTRHTTALVRVLNISLKKLSEVSTREKCYKSAFGKSWRAFLTEKLRPFSFRAARVGVLPRYAPDSMLSFSTQLRPCSERDRLLSRDIME